MMRVFQVGSGPSDLPDLPIEEPIVEEIPVYLQELVSEIHKSHRAKKTIGWVFSQGLLAATFIYHYIHLSRLSLPRSSNNPSATIHTTAATTKTS